MSRDGQKVLLAIRAMSGESEAGWRAVLDDLIARELRGPEFLITDNGAAGLGKALAALCPAAPAQRCTVHKHWNLLAHVGAAARGDLGRLHGHDLRHERQGDRGVAKGVPAQVAAEVAGRGRQPRGG